MLSAVSRLLRGALKEIEEFSVERKDESVDGMYGRMCCVKPTLSSRQSPFHCQCL